jgi:hypothetical protein
MAVFLPDGAVGMAENGLDVLHGDAPHGQPASWKIDCCREGIGLVFRLSRREIQRTGNDGHSPPPSVRIVLKTGDTAGRPAAGMQRVCSDLT